jgi:hypothetical protein
MLETDTRQSFGKGANDKKPPFVEEILPLAKKIEKSCSETCITKYLALPLYHERCTQRHSLQNKTKNYIMTILATIALIPAPVLGLGAGAILTGVAYLTSK